MRTFSRAVSAGKMWQSWKVRAIPFCATTCTGSPVIFSPAKMTSPVVGFSTLVIRLNTVDLPAPFGPMTARILPASRLMSTASTATSAPKRRTNPLHSSSGIGCLIAAGGARYDRLLLKACSHDAPNAFRREHDEGEEDRSEEARQGVAPLQKLIPHNHKKYPPDDGPDQRASAPPPPNEEAAAGDQQKKHPGRRNPGEAGIERARQPAETV